MVVYVREKEREGMNEMDVCAMYKAREHLQMTCPRENSALYIGV